MKFNRIPIKNNELHNEPQIYKYRALYYPMQESYY
jgi:hypothetical protein